MLRNTWFHFISPCFSFNLILFNLSVGQASKNTRDVLIRIITSMFFLMADLIYANAYVDFQYDGRLEVDDADYVKRRISIIQAHSKQT
jgi:hypothetical protein